MNFAYGLKVMLQRTTFPDKSCPFCGEVRTQTIGSKFGLVLLRRCSVCGLMFRWPKDSVSENRKYYNGRFSQIHCDDLRLMPPKTDERLEEMKAADFLQIKDIRRPLEIFQTYVPAGGKVLDFGCSWGYLTWRLRKLGYDTVGYDIDANRAAYGAEKLGLSLTADRQEVQKQSPFDAIFSYDTIEHLPALRDMFSYWRGLLAPNGILFLRTFNCNDIASDACVFQQKKASAFGEAHTLAFDADFFRRNEQRMAMRLLCVEAEKNMLVAVLRRVESNGSKK